MSRQQIERRLDNTRYQEKHHRILGLFALGFTAINGAIAADPPPHAERAFGLVFTVGLGLYSGWNLMKSHSDGMTAAQLEGVLAQDDLYREPTVLDSVEPTQEVPVVQAVDPERT